MSSRELSAETTRTVTAEPDTPLRIAQVGPIWADVPPRGYGGAELMVHWLVKGLADLGHEVTLYASANANTAGRSQPVTEASVLDLMADGRAYVYDYYAAACMTDALRDSDRFDVVHSHLGAQFIPYGAIVGTPVVHTVHNDLRGVDEAFVLARYAEEPVVAMSASQIADLPADLRARLPVIHHGMDFSEYEFSPEAEGYLAFIGRIAPKKNPVEAIRVARALDMPIRVAGKPQNSTEKQYFKEEVRPLLEDSDVTYLGPISQREKVELLRGASAVLFPIEWEEHFGLVMIEAMACGTPVVARTRGSVPEVIDSGVTGFHAPRGESLEPLVLQARELDRQRVYEQALKRFSHHRMAKDYERFYRVVVDESRQIRKG